MREFSVPPNDMEPPVGGLADTVYEKAEQDPGFVVLERRVGDRWQEVDARTFRDEVLSLAKGLLVQGIRFGDRVGIMAATRYEWTLFDYALWSLGAESVPVYPTSSSEQVRHILGQTRAVACLVENDDQVMTVGAAIDSLPTLARIWQIDAGAVEQLTAAGIGVRDEVVHRHRLAVTPESVATVVYTSGTTGRPKGCLITHGNMVAQVDNMTARFTSVLGTEPDGSPPSTLMFLPLAHVFGRTVQVSALRHGVRLGHQPSMAAADLLPAFAGFRPTFILAVPHVFEKVFYAAQAKAECEGHAALFQRAVDVAVRYAEAEEARVFDGGPGPGATLRLKHRMYDKLVYSRVRAVFGGRLHSAVSGGSALERRLGLFFAGAGIAVHEGYGLTESCSGATCNPPGRVRHGTVGNPVEGITVRIADDGEVLLRGEQVFRSYLDDPVASKQVLDGGWLATGDLGALDDEGYLVISGRKKDIIVTSGGKSVTPSVLEDRVRSHPLVAQCVVVGDDRPFVAALITLDPEALRHWLSVRGKARERQPEMSELTADKELDAEIRRAVAGANARVSRAESIRAFRILPRPFTQAEGLLTPSLKLRRSEVVRAYRDTIEALYAGSAAAQPARSRV